MGRHIDYRACEYGDTACCKARAMLVIVEGLILFELFHDGMVDFKGERNFQRRFWWIRYWWGKHTISWYKRGHPRW